jgi:hypothetical protein
MFLTLPPSVKWLFDGVGAAIMTAIGVAVYQKWRKSHKANRTVSEQKSIVMKETVGSVVQSDSIEGSQVAAGNNITQTSVVHHHYIPDKPETELIVSHPDPLKILQSLDELPPYDLNHACEKFVGLPVVWRITFDSLSRRGKETWSVSGTFRIPPLGRPAIIMFDLSSLPPELKVMYRNTPIWVRGAIKEVAYPTVIALEADPELLKIEDSF